MIDGATGLGDNLLPSAPSDAAWLTAAMVAAFERHAHEASDPSALLSVAAGDIEARFARERTRAPTARYEIPTAAVLVASFGADGIDIAELGDCAVFVAGGGAVDRLGGSAAGRALEQENARRLMGKGGGRTPEVLAFLREVRNKANTPEGYGIFAPEADCAARARVFHHRTRGTIEALLITDGYEAAIDDYGLFDAQSLLESAREDIRAPLRALRAVEADDPECIRFPRFKPSDDATALMVRSDGGEAV